VPICLYFAPESMSKDKYDEVTKNLEDAGQGSPDGRMYHSAFEGRSGIHVFDVWESQEKFDAFGETLMPILAEAGVDPGEPVVANVHNIIVG
jgi:hypothetical protein